jgi:transposase
MPRCQVEPDAGAGAMTVTAVLRARHRADWRGPRDGSEETCRLPQRRRGTLSVGARDDGGGSVLRGGPLFRAKRADRIKLVFWDGTGLCVFAKQLEDGISDWPNIENGVIKLSAAQLSAPLEGLDWRRVHEARETVTPTQPG